MKPIAMMLLSLRHIKKCMKNKYDKTIQPCTFVEGDLVLVYDQDHHKLGAGKLEPMWHGRYIITCVLHRGTCELVDYDGISLGEPQNGLYLKKYYAYNISHVCFVHYCTLALDQVLENLGHV
jgi:hypothetical protein